LTFFWLAIAGAPFAMAGPRGVVDLLVAVALGGATFLGLRYRSGIGHGWLRRRGPERAAASSLYLERASQFLGRPATLQTLLAAYPPIGGVVLGRVITNGWSPPHGPLYLFSLAAVLFGLIVRWADDYRLEDDEAPAEAVHTLVSSSLYAPEARRLLPVLRAGQVLLWSSSVVSFIWMASARPYIAGYF
jgi:hypothetical protein